MKKRLLILLLWGSILFSPLLNLGAYLRIDQVLYPLMIFLFIITNKSPLRVSYAAKLWSIFAISLSCIGLLNVWTSLLTANTGHFYFVINWPAKILLNVTIGLTVINLFNSPKMRLWKESSRALWYGLLVLGLIAIAQVAEFHHYLPNMGVNTSLSRVYPYRGEMTEAVLQKTGGYTLKMGGVGRATVTFDGHPILLGDFLAFMLVMFLPYTHIRGIRIMGVYLTVLLGLFLTLSRGSIVAYLGGSLIYFMLMFLYGPITGKLRQLVRFAISFLLIGLTLLAIFHMTPIGQSVTWRLTTIVATLKGTGIAEERIADRWPKVINALNEVGTVGWLFGVPGGYKQSTDSQYFWLLTNVGLIGVGLFLGLHFRLILVGWKYFNFMRTADQEAVFFGLSFIAAIVTLLVMYVVHPSLQGDRLLTTLVLVSMLLDSGLHEMHRIREDSKAESYS